MTLFRRLCALAPGLAWFVLPSPALASIPLAVDVTDGYTFSGFHRSWVLEGIGLEVPEPGPLTLFAAAGLLAVLRERGV